MFKDFFLFELKLRFRSISTYVFFLMPFLIAFFAVSTSDFGPIGAGKVFKNGPFALTTIFLQLTAFGSILIAAIFGPSILRDFQEDTYQLLFTKPISKLAYLGGRWAASLVTTVGVFSGLVWGAMAGAFMPWADRTRLAPIHFWWYLQPFLSVTVIQIFFLGSLFFCVAALTRRIVVVYLQGVALFALYLIGLVSVIATNKLERFWPSVFDSLGLIMFQNVTRYWTVVERNTQLVKWSGEFLYNRLVWTGVGILALLASFVTFPMSAEVLGSRRSSKHAKEAREEEAAESGRPPRRFGVELPRVTQVFGSATTWKQLLSMTRLRFFNIVHEVPFWAIALIMIVFVLISGHFAGRSNGVEVWPVTYLMVAVVSGQSGLFLVIIGALYAGELMWRERDVRFEQIHDSLPLRDWADFVSKFLALTLVETVLASVVLVCGLLSQAMEGYFRFELGQYAKEIYLIYLPQMLLGGTSGGVFYYNTHVVNKFRTAEQNRHRSAEYERRYKKYQRLAQPKVTAVDAEVDIYPERRSFSGRGYYTLVNHTDKPIDEVHVTDSRESVEDVNFDRPFRQTLGDKEYFYATYQLDKPLEPNESMRMNFRVAYTSRGFKDGNERPEFAYNGTFFDRDYFPFVGYNQSDEIDDPVRRREEKLAPLEEMAAPGDPYYSNINLFTSDSEWVTFHSIVSTSADQIAMAPGYLKRDWTVNGRRYFEYGMGSTRINNFFSFLSGRFSVKRDQWRDVKLEIYYQPGHEYNLDKMMDASKTGLDYYEKNFGPFQFQQFRVLEYPRYRQFAQSFPNTVPFARSEERRV